MLPAPVPAASMQEDLYRRDLEGAPVLQARSASFPVDCVPRLFGLP